MLGSQRTRSVHSRGSFLTDHPQSLNEALELGHSPCGSAACCAERLCLSPEGRHSSLRLRRLLCGKALPFPGGSTFFLAASPPAVRKGSAFSRRVDILPCGSAACRAERLCLSGPDGATPSWAAMPPRPTLQPGMAGSTCSRAAG